jgi:flagellar hook-length control protein FliK
LAATLQGDAKKTVSGADVKDLAAAKLTDSAADTKAGVKAGDDFATVMRDAAQDKGKDIAQDLKNASVATADSSSAGADRKLESLQALTTDGAAATDSLQKATATQAPTPQAFVQQLAATAAQLSPAAASDRISPRVGSNGWDQAVGQKVVWMVAGGKQTAELTLNPPDLGPMKIVLSVHNDQASAQFTAAQPEVREALESAMPKLRQMMSDAGVQLAGFSVGTQTPNQQNPQQFASSNSNGSGGNFADNASDAGLSLPVSAAAAAGKVSVQIGMVDTFV